MTVETPQAGFQAALLSSGRSPDVSEPDDVYGWLCGSWEL